MKFCTSCQADKPYTEFAKNSSKKDGYQSNCRSCKKNSDAKYYEANKEAQRKRNNNNRKRNQQFILNYLLNNPCSDCGEADPVVLEFDHTGSDKSFNIGDGGRYCSIHALTSEISKCEVVCSNCHRRRTARRSGNWFKCAT